MKTQRQMHDDAFRRIAERNELFLRMVNHPTNPLTRTELEELIKRNPRTWGPFEGYLDKIKEGGIC